MIIIDLQLYYTVVAAILAALAGMWGFRRIKSLFSSR